MRRPQFSNFRGSFYFSLDKRPLEVVITITPGPVLANNITSTYWYQDNATIPVTGPERTSAIAAATFARHGSPLPAAPPMLTDIPRHSTVFVISTGLEPPIDRVRCEICG